MANKFSTEKSLSNSWPVTENPQKDQPEDLEALEEEKAEVAVRALVDMHRIITHIPLSRITIHPIIFTERYLHITIDIWADLVTHLGVCMIIIGADLSRLPPEEADDEELMCRSVSSRMLVFSS
eukprot:TRINITY_DN2703_c0_g1_i1.p1 TRINITY_DN2703_c0_g1~~TRINITY_DN2703_c0_g1_i1.p1  ORF type:complete len:124 (-),score=18.09 TRINITY_DN2703_c0_g1_i1:51-422(-)